MTRTRLQQFLERIVTRLPARCALCLGPAGHQRLCSPCISLLPRLGTGCPRCALPGPGELCGRCLRDPPPQRQTIAAFRYAPPIRELIHGFKQSEDLVIGTALGELLAGAVKTQLHCVPSAVIPVPLHRTRLRERGFNQSGLLAEVVADALELPMIPDGLERTLRTEEQKQLSARQRERNLRNAFRGRTPMPDSALLIDDVMTTGATARAAAQALNRAGVVEISFACVARTPIMSSFSLY